MKKLILLCFIASALLLGCSKKNESEKNASLRENSVIVYAYSSFAGEWGAGEELSKLFKQKTGLDLVFVNCGDALQCVSRAILEKNNVQADVLLGPDNNLSKKVREAQILSQYKPNGAQDNIAEGLEDALGGDWILTPFDFSHFAIIFDTESGIREPKSLQDLTMKEYEKKLILMNPQTSTPGFGFAAWTASIFESKALDYWQELKPSILTMAPSWTAGYALFTSGEAPLVISYTTSPAYQYQENKSTRFKTLIFSEGHPMQVEGAGLLKGAKNSEGGKKFLDFLISDEAQALLPLTQWMYPANKNTKIPECYAVAAPIPEKTVSADAESVEKTVKGVIDLLF